MLRIAEIPLSVYNRALELYGRERERTLIVAKSALRSARRGIAIESQYPGITPFAQAIAEYLSSSGPWAEGGEYENAHDGYGVEI